MASIFNKKLPHSCVYCIHAKPSAYTDEIFCIKKGVTDKFSSCRHYKYDVFKRTPKKSDLADGYSSEDFEI